MGYLQAWRRMIHDDKTAAQPIEFVVHLGDFIYEVIFQPSENPNGYGGNPLRAMPAYPNGEKVQNDRWIPTAVEDYRTCYRHYLSDPDLQDARARWPFICMWDNHEFSQIWLAVLPAVRRQDLSRGRRARWRPTRPGSNSCRRASSATAR